MLMARRWCALAVVACAVGTGTTTMAAEEASVWNAVEDLRIRTAEQEAEIARLRAALHDGAAVAGHEGCGAAPGCCCNGCCVGPCCECGWYAAGELVWIEPRWKSFDALKVLSAATGAQQFPYEYDCHVSPRVWLGYAGCNGLGARASWWQFDHDAEPIAQTVGPNQALIGLFLGTENLGETVTATQSLDLETVDLEATNCYQLCDSRFLLAFGVRYVKADVLTRQQLANAGGAVTSTFEAVSSFEGIGPTLALEFTRALACSCLSLHASLRGTVAFGEQEDIATQRTILGLGGAVTQTASREADDALAIAELQIAVQWTDGSWFVRGGWQAQYWDDVASIPNSFGGLPLQQNTRSDLILQGFAVTLGAQF
jgi:hypothetical protein